MLTNLLILIVDAVNFSLKQYEHALFVSMSCFTDIFRWLPLICVMCEITLLSVIGFFTCCVYFVYVLCFVYVVFVLFTFVYVPLVLFTCYVICLVACEAWFDDLAVPRPITRNFFLYVAFGFSSHEKIYPSKLERTISYCKKTNLFAFSCTETMHLWKLDRESLLYW